MVTAVPDLARARGLSVREFLCREGITHVGVVGSASADLEFLAEDLQSGSATQLDRSQVGYPVSVAMGTTTTLDTAFYRVRPCGTDSKP